MTQPSVAIVIVNYNGAAFIEELAASLRAVAYENRRLFLVDNASTDGSGERLGTVFPAADIVLNERNLGLAPAINQAVARCLDASTARPEALEGRRGHDQPPAPTDYVLLLNPDTTHKPAFLETLVAAADYRTIVVPKVLNYHDRRLINTHAGGASAACSCRAPSSRRSAP
jgi:GT2 family glycosyltransferase